MKNGNDKASLRRVTNTEDFDWSRLEEEAQAQKWGGDMIELVNKNRDKAKKDAVKKKKKPKTKKERHIRTQKEQRIFEERIRAVIGILMATVIILSILLLTPIFDIRNISVSGNKTVTAEQVSRLVGDIKGTNLFLTSKGSIKKKLKTIKCIKDIEVDKRLIPPSVDIVLDEYIAAGYMQVGNEYIVFDKNLRVIGDGTSMDLNTMPCLTGVKLKDKRTGDDLKAEDEEVTKTITDILEVTTSENLTNSVVSIDLSDMSNITFNYENRINAYCGSNFDIDRKMRLFSETMKSGSIGAEAVGTIDLSEMGKAIYTP